VLIPKSTGKREDRYTHALCGEVDIEELQTQAAQSKPSTNTSSVPDEALINRIQILEEKVAKLESLLES